MTSRQGEESEVASTRQTRSPPSTVSTMRCCLASCTNRTGNPESARQGSKRRPDAPNKNSRPAAPSLQTHATKDVQALNNSPDIRGIISSQTRTDPRDAIRPVPSAVTDASTTRAPVLSPTSRSTSTLHTKRALRAAGCKPRRFRLFFLGRFCRLGGGRAWPVSGPCLDDLCRICVSRASFRGLRFSLSTAGENEENPSVVSFPRRLAIRS